MKICTKCEIEKDESEFFFKNKEKGKLHSCCRECYKVVRKNSYTLHYENNKEIYKERTKKRQNECFVENRKLLTGYLKDNHCTDCGNDNPIVLEFDHLGDKKYGISTMMGSYKWDKIMEEISKCEVVCSNCHRIRTAKRAGWYDTKMGND